LLDNEKLNDDTISVSLEKSNKANHSPATRPEVATLPINDIIDFNSLQVSKSKEFSCLLEKQNFERPANLSEDNLLRILWLEYCYSIPHVRI